MNFREFVKIVEDGGLFMTPGAPGPGQKHPLRNVDIYNHPFGAGATMPPAGVFAGSGPGLGNQQLRRMKKMKK
jgi:hypothetical protein